MTRYLPSETDFERASRHFSRFKKLPGSRHIASAFSLAHLSAVVKEIKPKTVLEYGAGIGTITEFLLQHPCGIADVVSTERNSFCISALQKNVGAERRWTLLRSVDEVLSLGRKFDLVIFDTIPGEDDQQFSVFAAGIACFVDGNRNPTREALESYLNSRGLTCRFEHYRPRNGLTIQWRKKQFGLKVKYVQKRGCYTGVVTPLG